ncbi:sodium- and chloride-dependent GABA transporter 1-like isoform X3 [Centruroides vittatus]|uniref:sodium- and chloride-dependent GABA transporter 1-like isoform X3 n=1 Tax=Centruroides vittatus TaxID=120091 RepID=UPI003510A33A
MDNLEREDGGSTPEEEPVRDRRRKESEEWYKVTNDKKTHFRTEGLQVGENVSEEDDERQEKTFPNYRTTKKRISRFLNRTKISSISKEDESRTDSGRTARDKWGSKWEFFLSCLGLSVGLGNVWRFPYLAYENGGGAFLIPYFVVLFLSGKPLYFLELAMGQFSGKSCLGVWSCAPLAKGVGIAMCSVTFCIVIYYNVILTYTLYYMSASFASVYPWNTCDLEWAKNASCRTRRDSIRYNVSGKTPSEIYWEKNVLGATDDSSNLGGIKWDLFFTLMLAWTVIAVCVVNGIKTSGKVVYFAATFPYAVLVLFFVVGLFRPGAKDGIVYFLYPTWSKLLNVEVWKAAAGQMFFSLGVSMGALISYGSYNEFHHDVYKDVIIISLSDTSTSILSGFVVFSTLGSLARDLDVEVSEVVAGGFGLAFVVYPEALNSFPLPQFWSFLFFFMLFTLGVDSQFGLVENLLTSISDEFPELRRRKKALCLALCLLCFLLGIPCVTRGGQYVVSIMDEYGGGSALVLVAVFECVGFCWVYGVENVGADVRAMLGFEPGGYWKTTWRYTCPLVLSFVFVYGVATRTPLSADARYPVWADAAGWCVSTLIWVPIPLWAAVVVYKQKASTYRRKLEMSLIPTGDWGPNRPRTENSLAGGRPPPTTIENGNSA